MKFAVNIKEIHNLEVEIEAENELDAKEKAKEALGRADESIINYDNLTYSHTLDDQYWTVCKIP